METRPTPTNLITLRLGLQSRKQPVSARVPIVIAMMTEGVQRKPDQSLAERGENGMGLGEQWRERNVSSPRTLFHFLAAACCEFFYAQYVRCLHALSWALSRSNIIRKYMTTRRGETRPTKRHITARIHITNATCRLLGIPTRDIELLLLLCIPCHNVFQCHAVFA